MAEYKIGDKVHLGFGAKGGAGFKGTLVKMDGNIAHVESEETDKYGKKLYKGPVAHLSFANSFQNGQAKALQAIQNKAAAVGVKLGNADLSKKQIEDKIAYYEERVKKSFGSVSAEKMAKEQLQKLKEQLKGGKFENGDPAAREQAKQLGAAAFARGEQASTPNKEYIKLAGQYPDDSAFLLRAYQQGWAEAKHTQK